MTLVTDLELPVLDYLDEHLRGERFHEAMNELAAQNWLASSPLGWLFVLDREAAAHFLRSRAMRFPAATAAEAFGVTEGPIAEAIRKNIISIEGEDHRRLRNIVNPAFSVKEADRRRPAMREHITELWAAVAGQGRCEFVSAVAQRYPSLMIATVVGAPLGDADRLHDWAMWFQRKFDPVAILEDRERLEAKIVELREYVQGLIDSRRADPGDDLISILLAASHQGDRLSEDECLNLVMNVFAGGIDTTRGQLAHGVRLFADHPDQWELLGREPALAPAAVEEILRFEPVTPFAARMTAEEVTYRGVTIPAGTVMLISTFAANRDPHSIAEPLRFDITADRGKVKPMTFGAGIHNCLGANLARAELQEAFAYLAPRMLEVDLDGEPRYESIAGVYGVEQLPIRFRAAAGG